MISVFQTFVLYNTVCFLWHWSKKLWIKEHLNLFTVVKSDVVFGGLETTVFVNILGRLDSQFIMESKTA